LSQKQDEIDTADALLRRLGYGQFELSEGPPASTPDVIAAVDGGEIAIEVTEYDGGPNRDEVAAERMFDRLRNTLFELIKDRKEFLGVDIELYGAASLKISKHKIDGQAREIREIISAKLPFLACGEVRLFSPCTLRPLLRAIRITRCGGPLAKHHMVPHSDFDAAYTDVPAESLERILNRKSERVRRALGLRRSASNAKWLVIKDGRGLRRNLSPPPRADSGMEALFEALKRSPFDRVYLFCGRRSVYELTPSQISLRAPYFD
jgi:hypothetical protein